MGNENYTYRIHPAIGFARVGNSPDSFYLEPASVGALPIECDEQGSAKHDEQGNEIPVTHFKEAGQIRRQAARFRVYRYTDGKDPVEVSPGNGLKSVKWTVHMANKKSAWWNFSELQGDIMVGKDNTYEYQSQYWKGPTLRNADTKDRNKLITDPGPRTVTQPGEWQELDALSAPKDYPVNFPSQAITPYPVTTLGRVAMTNRGEFLVLGGYGNAGGPAGQPLVSFSGGDGWFDDIGDGPVIAEIETNDGKQALNAWVVSACPKFAPELVNIATLADTFIDVGVRYMDLCKALYEKGAFKDDYVASFKRDIKPIFESMKGYRWVANVDAMVSIATPSFDLADASDGNRENRRAIFQMFRNPGDGKYADELAPDHQRLFADNGFPMMPMNSGDNSIRNYFIEKFMALNPTQYHLLRQWAEGKFVDDYKNDWASWASPLDIATAGNVVGEPMAPGIEVTWTMRNPDVLQKWDPFRIKVAPGRNFKLSPDRDETTKRDGCEPGDLTKRMAVPWQADFFDCTVQDVNFTTPKSNKTVSNLNLIPLAPTFYAYWWPAQSPFNVYSGAMTAVEQLLDGNVLIGNANSGQVLGQNVLYHRGLNSFGDAVVGWKYLGFVLNRTSGPQRDMLQFFVESERSYEAFQSGYYGMISDGTVLSTQPTTVTSTANVNATSQNVFPIQWLIGN
jgi:L-lysine 6-oxidase